MVTFIFKIDEKRPKIAKSKDGAQLSLFLVSRPKSSKIEKLDLQ